MSVLGALVAMVPSFVVPPGAPQGTPAQVGQWGALLDWGVQGKHMCMLPTGDVLVWSTGEKARVWDPETGNFTLTPATFGDLHCAGHVTLPDGRVIVLGGTNGDTHIGLTVTAIFDHTQNRWTQGRPMNFARWYASVTALADGRVLVTSGDDGTGERVLTPEVYDPVANTWTVLSNAVRDQSLYPLMYVLPDGRVYECGPKTSTAFLSTSGTGAWSSGPSGLYSTSGYSESAVMYAPGKILRAGGDDPAIARAMTIDMTVASPQWRETASMRYARRRLNLVLLADGSAMAVGGTRESDSESGAVLDCEIWNPATGLWSVVAPLSEPRMYHSTAILLPDGRVVTAGGEATGRDRAQIYSPPYLFKGARPVITSAPASLAFGSAFEVVTPNAASIAGVALLRPATATHAWDQNQRYVPLSFTPLADRLSVTAPPTGGVAPPGFYMLVIKDQNGVPSVARFLRVGSALDLSPGSIRGAVTDASSLAPIVGASVVTSERSTTTGAGGSYVLDPVSSGERQVTFSAPGYATVMRSIEVPGGGSATLNVALSQPGKVVGLVTDAGTLAPLAGALILHSAGTATTDANGRYSVEGLPAGTQTLTASAAGHTSLQKSAAVPSNGSVTLDFALVASETYIAGGVIDAATSQPIAGASVSYSGGSRTTDALGRYRFDDATAGTHRLTASASGYASQSGDVIVVSGAGSFHDFGLSAAAARIKNITFEGGSLTDPTTGADTKSGLGITLETANPLAGRYSAKVTGGSSYIDEAFTETNDLFLVVTFSVSALPAGDPRIVRIANSGTTVGNVQVRSSGRLRLRNDSAAIGAETAPLALNTLYRLGVHQRRGTGNNAVLEAYLAQGSAPFGAPFATLTSGTWTSAASRVQVGSTTGSVVSFLFDEVLLDAAAMPGGGGTPAPNAAFLAAPTSGTAPLLVSFTDQSTGNATSWSWTFGDGTSSSERNPTHSYSAGTFSVSLKASGPGGSDTETKAGLIVASGPSGGGLVLGNPTPGTAGVSNTVVVSGAKPNSLTALLAGQALGASIVPRGECGSGIPIGLASPYQLLQWARANASGVATFTINPGSALAGKLYHFQAIEPATCKASNLASDRL